MTAEQKNRSEMFNTFNCLTPGSDQHLISPYNITQESNIEVMRIKEMITE